MVFAGTGGGRMMIIEEHIGLLGKVQPMQVKRRVGVLGFPGIQSGSTGKASMAAH
jgi:hypothetical protein